MKRLTAISLIPLLSVVSVYAQEQNENIQMEDKKTDKISTENDKNPEDPTKIITKFGAGYNGDLTFNGSIGLDDERKIGFGLNSDASEWRVSGSWLFEKGILNFYFDGDEHRHSYSIGTFVPLHAFAIDTGQWMVFPMAGLNYITDKNKELKDSYGGYAGVFVLRPFDEQWTLLGWAEGGLATEGYDMFGGGAGLSYRVTRNQSVNFVWTGQKDSYRTDNKVGLNYTYEFNN